MTISRDGDHLTTQLTGQAALPIYPAGPLTFFLKIVDAQIRFVEEAGTVTGAVLTQNGRTTEAKKVE